MNTDCKNYHFLSDKSKGQSVNSTLFNLDFLSQSITLLLILFLLIFFLGCTHQIKRKDWSRYNGPGAEYFHKEEINPPSFADPYEPYNRGVSAFNHGFIVGIVNPACK